MVPQVEGLDPVDWCPQVKASMRVRSTTGMNTVVPGLLVVLGRSARDATLVVAAVALTPVLLVLAWRLARSGTAEVTADRLVLRGPLRSWTLPRAEVSGLSVDGLNHPASLGQADALLVSLRDGSERRMGDFAQSSYARGRDHSLEWLVGRVNGAL